MDAWRAHLKQLFSAVDLSHRELGESPMASSSQHDFADAVSEDEEATAATSPYLRLGTMVETLAEYLVPQSVQAASPADWLVGLLMVCPTPTVFNAKCKAVSPQCILCRSDCSKYPSGSLSIGLPIQPVSEVSLFSNLHHDTMFCPCRQPCLRIQHGTA